MIFESTSSHHDKATVFRVSHGEVRHLAAFGAMVTGWHGDDFMEVGCVCGHRHTCQQPIYHSMIECPNCRVRIYTVKCAGWVRFGLFAFVISEDLRSGRRHPERPYNREELIKTYEPEIADCLKKLQDLNRR